jgi:RNA polymerase sigma-70 factor (sigma-E family)
MDHYDRPGRQAFAEYFAARRDVVRRTAFLLCGDVDWADDLTQATFVKVATAWERIRDPQALDAFVRTCLIRTYLAESRRIWRRREYASLRPPESTYGDPTDGDPTENIARRLAFMDALKQLPPRQRAVLVCRFYQDLDVNQTAEALNCSAGTVKSQTARGLATLRGLVEDGSLHIARDELTT